MIGVALLSLLTAFSGAIVPGTLFALTVNQALVVGWTAGLWLMVGHMLAELALLLALRLGLGGVLRRKAVTRAIGLIGGAVLLYFAWDMIALARGGALDVAAGSGTAAMSVGMLVVQGALLSLLNPYWGLWWVTVGVGLVAAQTAQHGPRAWPAFFLGHITADFLWYGAVSALVAFGGRALPPAVHRGLILGCALLIAVLGLVFIVAPLREITRRPAPDMPADSVAR